MMTTELAPASFAARTLCFDLHPLYAGILADGSIVREGEVIGLDNDLSRALVAPFTGILRLLVSGQGEGCRVKVYLSEGAAWTPPAGLRGTAHYRDISRN